MNWSLVAVGPIAAVWAMWLGRVRSPRLWDDRFRRAECDCFLAVAICLTLQLPLVADWVDRAAGITDVSRLIANVAGIVAAWRYYPCAWLFRSRDPLSRLKSIDGASFLGSVRLMLCTSGALVALFIFNPGDASHLPESGLSPSPFTIYHQSLAYTLVYLGYLGAITTRMFFLALHNDRRVALEPVATVGLQLQLRAQAVGWAAGTAFAAHECADALRRWCGWPAPIGDPALVSSALLVTAIVGVTGGEVRAPWQWMIQYRSCRRLYPLWSLLSAARPPIALKSLHSPPRSAMADVFGTSDVTLRRLRRVIEIRDGILALRPHCDERIAARADAFCRRVGLSHSERLAVIEATVLIAASHESQATRQAANPHPQRKPFSFITPESFEEEVAHLERVSDAVAHSPIVTTVTAEASRATLWPRGGLPHKTRDAAGKSAGGDNAWRS